MHIRLKKWVKVLIFIIIICTLFFLYSRYIETNLFNIKEYPVVNSNIPSNFYGLKIVQISDIHYKSINDKKYLNKVVKKINLLKPDIVILSGDLFDSNIKYSKSDYEDLVNILKNINYNIGKYAIIGEEDNLDKWNYVIENSDFINLNDNFNSSSYEYVVSSSFSTFSPFLAFSHCFDNSFWSFNPKVYST